MIDLSFLRPGIKDAIDILLVSAIIYQVLRLTRGTRSSQIILGLTALGIIAFVAYLLQLEGLTWVFSNLATFGLIVLVIVFQPELRSALASFGQTRLFRMFGRIDEQRVIEEVATASLRLAELRYGGLIVIERSTGLRNFAETGKLLSAKLSHELLVTLFTPYTPLHDGAVIVAGDDLIAAAASLPLTSDPRYRDLFGMRHKAAVGVSEQSDAVVIVVSEETGGISIAFDGELERDIPRARLRERLAHFLSQ